MAALIQTIAVVDKSGKAVSTSKHLVNVFKEAKAAYRERKAEVVAGRRYEIEEKRQRKSLKGAAFDDKSNASSRTPSRSHNSSGRPPAHHQNSGSSVRSPSRVNHSVSERRHSQDTGSPHSPKFSSGSLARRHSAHEDDYDIHPSRQLAKRSMTSPVSPLPPIDMDLAYGPIPPPLPVARSGADEEEFRGHVQKVKRILEEADCLQYSASAIIATLQKNPDAMAAVALTLAEISNVVTKMAPGVLTAMKASSPAVFALLASPQFLIAGGVAVGVTVVAFGGYKIVKKIRAKHAVEVPGTDEMLEIGGDVNRIDNWRRGIAEEQERSIGTSVEGEFITPTAAALTQLNLDEARASDARRSQADCSSKQTSPSASKNDKASKTRSRASSRESSKAGSKAGSKKTKKEKVKKPSPLRLILS